jgi:hypothetical protein
MMLGQDTGFLRMYENAAAASSDPACSQALALQVFEPHRTLSCCSCCFSYHQDVANLSKLSGLQELCLADPFWGECPVAALCNYQTFMLYLMPHLSSLDTLLLADETKAAASTTFTKKQLYYNMRIRTMRRAAAGLARQAKAGCQVGI